MKPLGAGARSGQRPTPFIGELWKTKLSATFFDSTDMEHLRARQSMFISMLLGGRVVYTGKEISAAHAHARAQGLTDKHFDAFLKHFRAALDEVGVKPDKAAKVMKLLEAKRGTVLNR